MRFFSLVSLALITLVWTAPAPASADGGWRALVERFMRRAPEAPDGRAVDGRAVDGRARASRRGWRTPGATYALDGVSRRSTGQRPDCPTDELVRHRGTNLRYARSVRVHEAFVPRLEAFEAVARDLAIEIYGRAPRRIIHSGTFACRASRGRRSRISEHAFGNALDLKGFDFGPKPRGEELPEGLHRSLRRGFQVRVARHWSPRRERDAVHAEFLHRLTDTLRGRPDIFRGIVGPPRPRHHDHLHLDAAPWRYALYHHD